MASVEPTKPFSWTVFAGGIAAGLGGMVLAALLFSWLLAPLNAPGAGVVAGFLIVPVAALVILLQLGAGFAIAAVNPIRAAGYFTGLIIGAGGAFGVLYFAFAIEHKGRMAPRVAFASKDPPRFSKQHTAIEIAVPPLSRDWYINGIVLNSDWTVQFPDEERAYRRGQGNECWAERNLLRTLTRLASASRTSPNSPCVVEVERSEDMLFIAGPELPALISERYQLGDRDVLAGAPFILVGERVGSVPTIKARIVPLDRTLESGAPRFAPTSKSCNLSPGLHDVALCLAAGIKIPQSEIVGSSHKAANFAIGETYIKHHDPTVQDAAVRILSQAYFTTTTVPTDPDERVRYDAANFELAMALLKIGRPSAVQLAANLAIGIKNDTRVRFMLNPTQRVAFLQAVAAQHCQPAQASADDQPVPYDKFVELLGTTDLPSNSALATCLSNKLADPKLSKRAADFLGLLHGKLR